MNICVYGAASDKIDITYVQAVQELGEEIAKRGHGLVFGAGGTGLMGAAARGAYKMGGYIYGVIPSFFLEAGVEPIFDKCSKIKYTKDMRERKAEMENNADAFIVVPGGIGTFEEFFEVLTLKQLGRHNKPIAVYSINGYYDKLEENLDGAVKKNFIPQSCTSLYHISSDLDSIFEYIENQPENNFTVKQLKN